MGSTGLPQDLLLIQGFVDVIPTFTASADKASTTQPTDQVNVHVPNSDSEDDLEERAVVKLIVDTDEDDDNSSLVRYYFHFSVLRVLTIRQSRHIQF
jgi:hypothetical protein